MNSIVKAEVQITFEDYRKRSQYNGSFRKNGKFRTGAFVAFCLFLVAWIFLMVLLQSMNFKLYYLGFDFIYLAIPILQVVVQKNRLEKQFQKLKINIPTYSFSFDDHGFSIDTMTPEKTSGIESKYYAYIKAIRWRDIFIFYAGYGEEFILPLRCITAGTAEQLEALLRQKLGSMYIE